MKIIKSLPSYSLIAVALMFFLSSCEDKVTQELTFTANVPIYMSMNEVLSDIDYTGPKELSKTGKIYSYGSLLYIGERGEGVHVYDNADPKNPRNIGFLSIPGNKDIAIKGSYLYADCHTDLLVFKMNSASSYELVNRVEGVFEYVIPNYDQRYPLATIDESKGLVIGYEVKEITEERQVKREQESFLVREDANFSQTASPSFGGVGESSGRTVGMNAQGVAGSFAQFMVVDDYLYVMSNDQEIQFYNISNGASIQEDGSFNPGWGIETLFKNGKYLFIGGERGMFIYNVEVANNPISVSEFQHAESCDPVVADDKYAYVTLRTGTECMGVINQLDILNIENISNPSLIKTIQMTNPHGVGIDPENQILFVCDGSAGLKVFDAKDVNTIHTSLIQHIEGLNAFDVIPTGNGVMMIAEDGLYQFEYTNTQGWLGMLSVINTVD